ncbi:hypothetical protein, partial [Streptomyces virginiae]|uniref:hypothetical protein n=1 Tax=Streptomyces virginiae TaxID=1961 RepID=UPI001BDDD60C
RAPASPLGRDLALTRRPALTKALIRSLAVSRRLTRRRARVDAVGRAPASPLGRDLALTRRPDLAKDLARGLARRWARVDAVARDLSRAPALAFSRDLALP